MNKYYTFHDDPGHGWLGVPMADLRTLGITDAISGYSYLKDNIAYLEEDCDYTTFVVAARSAGWTLHISDIHEDPTPIRNYPSYPASPGYRDKLNAAQG